MKKLMIGLVAASATIFAFGDLPSGTSFEAYATGEKTIAQLTEYEDDGEQTSGDRYWFYEGDKTAAIGVITNDTPNAPSRPAQFAGNSNLQYLDLTASDATNVFYRAITNVAGKSSVTSLGGQSIGNGLYLDTLVKFTPGELTSLELGAGDKIALTYVEETDDEDGDGKVLSNIVVRAGYVNGSTIDPTNYIMNAISEFSAADWHRLTVRAINVGYADAPVGFVVYVDGVEVTYDLAQVPGDSAYLTALAGNSIVANYLYNTEKHAFIPSAVSSEDVGFDELHAVGFKGNGCVDDISFTATPPTFIQEGTTVAIAWDANVTSYTVATNGTTMVAGEAVSGAGSANLLIADGTTTITVSATYGDGYTNGVWTASAGTLSAGDWTGFESGATLTIKSLYPYFQVGDAYYQEFAGVNGALAAALVGGGVIKLNANYSESIAFSTGTIVLDLNGKTLQGGDADEYTIVNSGATLTIIDSLTGGTVEAPTYDGALGAFYTDGGQTTINAGTFESTVYTEKMQASEAAGDIVVNGGVFADPDYNPGDTEAKFYLYDYLGTGVEATYNAGYFTVGSPIIGTYSVTVTPTANATYAAVYNEGGAAVEFVNDVAAVTVGKTITITATPGSGYEYAETPAGWTAGQDGEITIEVSAEATVAIPAPTAESSWSQPSEDTPEAVDTALEADGFSTATGVVTNKVEYDALIAYVEDKTTASSPEGLTAAQKANAVLCYALQASAIPATEIVKEDVTIDAIETGDDGAVDLTVAIDGVTVGASVPTATLTKIVTAKGGEALGSMSTENVTVSGHAVETGKVKITVTPKADSPTSFFTSVIINK